MTKLLAFVVAAVLGCSPAFAGSATVNYTSAGSSPFRTTTDGSANNIGQHTVWDSVAGANGLAITVNNAAKMEGVGVAGTAAGGILTVQGVASMTALLVSPSSGNVFGVQTQGSTTSGQSGSLVLAAVTTAAPTYTTAQTNPLSLDTAGNLRVNVMAGGAVGGTSSTFGAAFPATGTAIGLTSGTNMVAWSATTNYGTAPAAIAVPAVNASVTNVNNNGQATMANSSPVVIASNQPALTVQTNSQYPTTSTPLTASATGTTAATTATLAGSAAVTTYLCGFSIRANATAAVTGNATVTGTISGTLNFTQWTAPLASGLGVTEEIFTPCLPATGSNTAIAVVSAAPGTGGTVSVTAWGYRL